MEEKVQTTNLSILLVGFVIAFNGANIIVDFGSMIHEMRTSLEEVGKDLTAGTMAGIAQLLVGHPFDTVKVKLQSQMIASSNQPPQYTGALDAVKKILANEGPKGLYRGLGAPLATVALFNAVLFTARGQMEAFLLHNRKPYTPLSIRQQMVAGAGAGVAVTFVACPTELVKCRLQAQSAVENSELPIAVNVSANEQNHGTDLPPGNIHGSLGPQLNGQEDTGLRTMVTIEEAIENDHDTVGVGGIPSTLENLESQRQGSSLSSSHANVHKYKGSFDVARHIFRCEGGWIGFFKGITPTFLREVFGNAAYFGSYQGMKQLMSRGEHVSQLSMGSLLVAGGVAGAMFWLCVYPADVIKSMIQVDDYQNPKYTSTFDAFRKVFKAQGMKGLYCGFGPAMTRSVLANAVCFLVYELVRKALK